MATGQSVAAGWTAADVGRPPVTGTVSVSSQDFSVTSRGFDVNGTADQFTFVYRSVRGDATIIAKLESLQNVDSWSQSGIMIRESLDQGSNHGYVFGSVANGLGFRTRKSARSGTSQVATGAGAAPVWLKLERRSSSLNAYRSADGVNWASLGTVKLQMAQTVLVGLVAASHTAGASATATLSNVSVNGVGALDAPPANVAPTVSLNSPGNGATFTAPASISMGATAADSDGTVAKVDFYSGSTLIGSDTSSPYTFSWSNVPAGSYALKAVATDNAGAATTSATVNVSVNANTPPTVSMTSPGSGATFVAPAALSLGATAADSNGISKVDFYNGATLLASDTTSPYSFSWSNVPAGSYALRAVATDNAGASTTSATVNVTVNANQAPTVSLTSPVGGASFTAPASISLIAAASDADGSIQKVEFYNGSTLLASSTVSPYLFTWLNVPVGSYSLSAVAKDNLGATTVSSWSDITVGSTSTLSKAIFTPAVVPDTIDYYVFEIYAAGSDPNVAAPIAVQNLGVPAAVNGECTVDVKGTITGLAPGNYIATVSAVSSIDGTLRSAPSAFTR